MSLLHKVTLCVALCACWHTPGYSVSDPSLYDLSDIDAALEAHDRVIGNGPRCARQRRHVRVAYLEEPQLSAACRVRSGEVDGCHTTQNGPCFPHLCSHVLIVRSSLPPLQRRRILIHEAMHWADECTFGVEYPDNDHSDPLWNKAVDLAREMQGLE